ncbi:MAG TPA: SIS domain-containing protein [Rhodanobacteraceae bacterium]|nr:SIS domain-containing protein [Rhodanobacteraceae bacterium]
MSEPMQQSGRAPQDTRMFAEAQEAAEAIARQLLVNAQAVGELAERLRAQPPRFIVTCARGSSDHAATFGKYLFETQLGLVTASASPSIGSVYAVEPQLRDALFIAISQSGRSPDLLRNAELARASGACVVALVNVPDSPLGALADHVIPLRAGPETSVAATKSYLCSLSALLQLAASWSEDAELATALEHLPDALRASWKCDWSAWSEELVDARDLFVVGRGLGLAAAQEAALKLKETCGLHAEAFSSAEVMHGPMAIVGPGFPVLALVQDDESAESTLQIARTFRERGAHVWLAQPGVRGEHHLPLPQSPHPACTPLLTVNAFYRAANALALARGHDPDVPPWLNKVTETL